MSAKRINSPRLIQLSAFVATIEEGSFTAAGKVIGCDQSTVTKYVEQLGEWLETQLFWSGTTQLTATGENFLPVAREVVRAMEEAKHNIAQMKQVQRPPVDPRIIKI